ncbi:MAG: cytochrome c oxidase subunit 3 [Anaerolineae bacterium]|nr:cytochrome c oxidase subunit 3 [Anaerolineae bacterium]
MWAFLTTEVMFFGGLFVAYAAYRLAYPEAFAQASRELDMVLSTANTLVLLASSLMMALGVHAAQTDKKKALVAFLLLTVLLGLVFLGIKAVEYGEKFQHHLVPGADFIFPGSHANQAAIFFALYFTTTGLHAVHMIIGIGILLYFTYRAWQGHFSSLHYDPVEMIGLYWHFVDIVWVFIFPLYYLIDRT